MKRDIRTSLIIDGEREYKKALSDASREMTVLRSEMTAAMTGFDGNNDAMEMMTKKSQILRKELDVQEGVVESLKKAVDEASEKYGESDKRTDQYRIKLNRAKTSLNKLNKEFNENDKKLRDYKSEMDDAGRDTRYFADDLDYATDKADDAGDSFGGVFDELSNSIGGDIGSILSGIWSIPEAFDEAEDSSGLSAGGMALALTGVATAGAAIVTKLIEIGTVAREQAEEVRIAAEQMRLSMGLSEYETALYEDKAVSLYWRGYTPSIEQGMEDLKTVKSYSPELSMDELYGITGIATSMEDVYGVDLSQLARDADILQSKYGGTLERSYDSIATLLEGNAEFGDEILDVIREYTVPFEEIGFSQNEMMGMLQYALDNEVYDLDKFADGIKEINIRLTDGSETTTQALIELGLAADELEAKDYMDAIADGGDEAAEKIFEVLAALDELGNTSDRERLGVALIGTPSEDIGVDMFTSIRESNINFRSEIGTSRQLAYEWGAAQLEGWSGVNRQFEIMKYNMGKDINEFIIDQQELQQEYSQQYWQLDDSQVKAMEAMTYGQDIGEALGEGTVQGITDKTDAVIEATESLADEIPGLLKDKWEIKSPSALFGRIGGFAVEGLSNEMLAKLAELKVAIYHSLNDIIPLSGNRFSLESTIQIRHSGTLRVEGVNTQNDLVGVSNIIVDELMREGRL